MRKPPQIIDKEPAALLGLDWQWENGDKFALVEAVALCAANGWDYPKWVRGIIDGAMANLYRAVYPDVELDATSLRALPMPIDRTVEHDVANRLKRELAHSLDLLGLKIDRSNAIKRRRETLRNLHLAHAVGERCRFVDTPSPKFLGVNQAMARLAEDLQDEERCIAGGFPADCWRADEQAIKRAWQTHRRHLLEYFGSLPRQ